MSPTEDLDFDSVLQELKGDAYSSPVQLCVLTDEEISILATDALFNPLPLPWISAQESRYREAMYTTALRGLVSKGLVEVLDEDGKKNGMRYEPALGMALSLRANAKIALFSERVSRHGSDLLAAYSVDSEFVLTETITLNGLHYLVLCLRQDLHRRLLRFVDPVGLAPSSSNSALTVIDKISNENLNEESIHDLIPAVESSAVSTMDLSNGRIARPSLAFFRTETELVVGEPDREPEGELSLASKSGPELLGLIGRVIDEWDVRCRASST